MDQTISFYTKGCSVIATFTSQSFSVTTNVDIDYFAFQGDEFHLTEEQEKWAADIMLSVTLVKLVLVIYC